MTRSGKFGDVPVPEPVRAHLSRREREVLRAVLWGFQNAEIAQRLGVEENTVKKHVHRILAKTECRDRTQLVVRIHAHAGWLDRGEWCPIEGVLRPARRTGTATREQAAVMRAVLRDLLPIGSRLCLRQRYASAKRRLTVLVPCLVTPQETEAGGWSYRPLTEAVAVLLNLEAEEGALVIEGRDPATCGAELVAELAQALGLPESAWTLHPD